MEWGASTLEIERDVKRVRDREWLRKGCSIGHKLDRWSSIYEGFEKG
jgi:hypothetical protein